ncbi:MAG TPA: ferric reductase-like transmembrane domain-containing protein [Actinomycetota bacterium]|nr:ferric reductase-like transmembrane domain-containing protein [Actinomycetota bacterium]
MTAGIAIPLADASSNGRALWYLTRGTGVVALLLLTSVVVLGIVNSLRWSSDAWPRFVLQRLHRNLSLLAVVFICVHVASSVIDAFAPLRWIDAVLPFAARYRPLWLGLGTVAFDLILALVATSLLRARIGHRSWRAVHWLAYACWPVALLHGLGTGSDAKQTWMLALDVLTLLAVLGATWWRLGAGQPAWTSARRSALAATLLVPLGISIWAVAGPLHSGWARTAGTPANLLAGGSSTATRSVEGRSTSSARRLPSQARFDGSFSQSGPANDGTVRVDLRGRLSGSLPLGLTIDLHGVPESGGGLSVQGGSVALGTVSDPRAFTGAVQGIDDGRIRATLADATGTQIQLTAGIQISGASATGEVWMSPSSLGGTGDGE